MGQEEIRGERFVFCDAVSTAHHASRLEEGVPCLHSRELTGLALLTKWDRTEAIVRGQSVVPGESHEHTQYVQLPWNRRPFSHPLQIT